jgi:hypothetical protein
MSSDHVGPGYALTAKRRSLTKTEKMGLLAMTNGLCWNDYHNPGSCPQQGTYLTVHTVRAAHRTAHSRGGDDFVPMCEYCNAVQGVFELDEYEVVLLYRQLGDDQKIAFKQQLTDCIQLQKSNKKTA